MTAELAAAMTSAASELLDVLAPQERGDATFPFDSDERTTWHYTPVPRRGVAMGRLAPAAQKLVHRLLSSGLSLSSHAKVAAIVALEDVLDRMERGRMRRSATNYFVSVFGMPGEDAWGWRFEGHHVSVNWTLDGDAAACTPLFLGSNPATVAHGGHEASRPLREEEEAARDLLSSLDASQREAALVWKDAPADVVSGNLAYVERVLRPGDVPNLVPETLGDDAREALVLGRARLGIGSSNMDGRQRELLSALVAAYVERVPEAIAAPELARLSAEDVFFAWAGAAARRGGHYYRLEAPGFLVEYDNTQNDANHVHSVWRVPERDFGGPSLRTHGHVA